MQEVIDINIEPHNLEYPMIKQLKGVDGYIRFDLELKAFETEIPEGIDTEDMSKLVKEMLANQRNLGLIEVGVLLTEKGVLLLSLIENSYLLVIAGYTKSVDVTKLIKSLEIFRQSKNA